MLVKVVAVSYGLDPDAFCTAPCRKCGVSSMQVCLAQKSLVRALVTTGSVHMTASATQRFFYPDPGGGDTAEPIQPKGRPALRSCRCGLPGHSLLTPATEGCFCGSSGATSS